MDTKGMQKNYAELTPRERVALLLAAAVRKDEKELAALESTRGRKTFSVPEGTGVAEGFFFVASAYAIRQLGNAANIFLFCLWADAENDARKKRTRGGMDADKTLRVAVYLFQQTRDAWRDFCASIGMVQDAADAFISTLADMSTFAIIESVANEITTTEEDARTQLETVKEKFPGVPLSLQTRTTILKEFTDAYTSQAGHWGEA